MALNLVQSLLSTLIFSCSLVQYSHKQPQSLLLLIGLTCLGRNMKNDERLILNMRMGLLEICTFKTEMGIGRTTEFSSVFLTYVANECNVSILWSTV